MTPISEEICELAAQADANWGADYGLFGKIVEDKKLKIGAEVGVAFGGHSESLLTIPTIEKLYGVDPYLHMSNYADPMNLPQVDFDQIHQFALQRLAPFGQRYQHIKKSSEKAAAEVPELDFVYLDADHSYEGIWQDLIAWYPKVRIGGVIGGHDYGHPNFAGVKKGVDQFFNRFGWRLNIDGRVWSVEKQELNISFFMPAYNCASTVVESVESIMNGNFSAGDELIVVNDGSTDNTKDKLCDLAKKYPEIKTFQHEHNQGGGEARNTAIKNSCNQILFCLDSDNILEPHSIRRLKDFMENSGADVSSFQEVRYFKTDRTETTHTWVYKDEIATLADQLSRFAVPAASGNYMFTKDSWIKAGGYPDFAQALDAWGFGFRQLATGSVMSVMPSSHYYHRYGHESYWVRSSKTAQTSILALQILMPFIDLINDKDRNYMMSRRGKDHWFDRLEERPIRLKTQGREPRFQRIQAVSLNTVSRLIPDFIKKTIREKI